MDGKEPSTKTKAIKRKNQTDNETKKRSPNPEEHSLLLKDEVEQSPKKQQCLSQTISNQNDEASSSSKLRMEFDFWAPHSEPTAIIDTKPKEFKIRNITATGKIFDTPIRVRISFKSVLRKGRSCEVFSFHGYDGTDEIEFISFDNQTTGSFHVIQVNGVYDIQNFNVKKVSEKFPNKTGNPLQLQLNKQSRITETKCEKEFAPIPFKFIKLNTMKELKTEQDFDTMAIYVMDWGVETTSNGTVKRDIAVTDLTKTTMKVTLWNQVAEEFNAELFSVIIFRNAQTSIFNGISSINCGFNTLIWVNPETEEASELKKWFHAQQRGSETENTMKA